MLLTACTVGPKTQGSWALRDFEEAQAQCSDGRVLAGCSATIIASPHEQRDFGIPRGWLCSAYPLFGLSADRSVNQRGVFAADVPGCAIETSR
jgi:hypothetical protein